MLPALVAAAILSMGNLPVLAQAIGDLNADGRVDDRDLELLQRYLRGEVGLTDGAISAADINSDGQITQADADQLQQIINATAPAPGANVVLESAYSGEVIDRLTQRPLANVQVEIPGAGVTVTTDAQGRFRLPDVPANEILTARVSDYAPYSQTTNSSSAPLRLELQQLDPNRTLVLESTVVHLGDDLYSEMSAAARDFRLPTQGIELIRTFRLEGLPRQPVILRLGSLIGLDTSDAYRAGQTQIPSADMSPLQISLNGSHIHSQTIAGDNIQIPLPPHLLRPGLNTVEIRTGQTRQTQAAANVPVRLFGGSLTIGVPVGAGRTFVDYDDIELANITIELPDF